MDKWFEGNFGEWADTGAGGKKKKAKGLGLSYRFRAGEGSLKSILGGLRGCRFVISGFWDLSFEA